MALAKLTMAALVFASGFHSVLAQNCSSVHIIVARASTEPPGTGIIGLVAKQVQSQVSGVDIASVDYPATLDNYVNSQTAGVTAMTSMVTDYVTKCPNSKIVLMGYSQGAQVSVDVVCGATENGFPATQALPKAILDKIAAIAVMGDPSFAPGQSFDVGNATVGGLFKRVNVTTTCAPVADKMISYCDSGDKYCDQGQGKDALQIHISYVQEYGTNATDFVVSQLKKASVTQSQTPAATQTSTANQTSAATQTPVPVSTSAGIGRGQMFSAVAWVLSSMSMFLLAL